MKTLSSGLIAIIVLLVISNAVTATLLFTRPEKPTAEENDTSVENTLRCNQLYELKKEQYWGENIGQSKVIYSRKLNTCLAYNLYSRPIDSPGTETYFGMLKDMGDDKTLLYYTNDKGGGFVNGEKVTCERSFDYIQYSEGGQEVEQYGCDEFGLFDKMFEIIRSYGFEVFSG